MAKQASADVSMTICQSLAVGTLFVLFLTGSTRSIMKYNT